MENKKVRVGFIGFGGVAGYNHCSGGYDVIGDRAEITAVCDIKDSALERAKKKFNLPDECLFKDYHDLLNSGLVDAVDICTPNHVHCEIANAAIKAGIPFSIEKPIGINFGEVIDLVKAAKDNNIPSFVCFTWRYRPYTRYVRDIIKSGKLGKIYNIYIRCIKDSGLWEGRRLEWRFDKVRSGTGVLGDLGSHMIDITRFWGEEFDGVFAQMGTYITKRPAEDSDEICDVTTDDWCNINGMTKSGIPVTIHLSRVATSISDLIEFEVFGENGKLIYKYDGSKGQSIEYCDCTESKKNREIQMLTPPDSYKANQSLSFVNLLCGNKDEYTSELEHGVECQKVLDAAELSAKLGRYVKVSEIEDMNNAK